MFFDAVCMFLNCYSGEKDGKKWYRFNLLSDSFESFSIFSTTPCPDTIKAGDTVDCKFRVYPDPKTKFFRLQLKAITPAVED